MADSNTPPTSMMDLANSLKEPGFRLVDAGQLYQLFHDIYSTTPNVAARGTTQATATPLISAVNSVLSATGTNNSVLLPPGLLGKKVIIVNNASVAINVWPSGNDLIIPAASGTPTPNAAQQGVSMAAYVCIAMAINPFQLFYWKQAAPT